MRQNSTLEISLTSYLAGGTITLPVNKLYEKYIIKGTNVVTGAIEITTSGTLQDGHTIKLLWVTGTSMSGGSVVFMGKTISGLLVNTTCFEATYYESTWYVIQSNAAV